MDNYSQTLSITLISIKKTQDTQNLAFLPGLEVKFYFQNCSFAPKQWEHAGYNLQTRMGSRHKVVQE